MNVVLYMRYSSDRQTEQSIEGQERICTEFCKREGYTIVGKYIDRATSAFKDTEKRIEFNRMIKDGEKMLWEGVIVYKLDRFARNRYDAATYKAKLKKNGVRVISATENISDNPEGVILEAVLEGMAEFYSKELSQKVTRGMMETAYKCNNTGGHIPLGYKVENKKLVIDEPSAQIVREAFNLYVNGTSIKDICDLFNNKGYRTAKGSVFNKNSFNTIFTNERYIGVYKYKDVRIEGGVPAIIDKDTFQSALKRHAANVHAPARGKAKVRYLLTQKLFCGHCGAPMIGDCGTSRTGNVYNYYTCSTKKKGKSCDKKPLPKDFIEKTVVKDAMALLTPENIDIISDMAIKQNLEDIQNDKIIPVLEKQQRELVKSIENLLKLVERGAESETLVARLDELERQKHDIEKRIDAAKGEYIILDKEQVVWWLSRFAKGDINDEEFCRQLIDLLVNSVTVWDDPDGYRITATYNLTDNNTRVYRISSKDGGSDLVDIGSPLKKHLQSASAFFFAKISFSRFCTVIFLFSQILLRTLRVIICENLRISANTIFPIC